MPSETGDSIASGGFCIIVLPVTAAHLCRIWTLFGEAHAVRSGLRGLGATGSGTDADQSQLWWSYLKTARAQPEGDLKAWDSGLKQGTVAPEEQQKSPEAGSDSPPPPKASSFTQ